MVPAMGDLANRLRARIRTTGPISFAEFMEAALYDPAEGYFSRTVIGQRGDFVTAPHLSPLFGALVAVQVEDFWLQLGRPDPFHVIEVGAGDGTLARQILVTMLPPLRDAVRYVAVDRSPAARAALVAADEVGGFTVAERLSDVGAVDVGCVIGNEVLDNLPLHRVRVTGDGPVELRVGLDGASFVLTDDGPPPDEVAALIPPGLSPGEERAIGLEAVRLVEDAVAVLGRGYVWLADYAAEGGRGASVHGYREGAWTDDVLVDPGSSDITAGVDFDLLAAHARSLGLRVWGPVRQRDALLSLGFRELDERAQARQVEAVQARRGVEAMRIYSNRGRANLLLGRGGLGAFQVLCVGVHADGVPRSMLRPNEPE
jgi:SAM-dependent MidA family methyltransferase